MTPFKTIKPSTLDRDAFVAAFADVYEHSPWVAETSTKIQKPATATSWAWKSSSHLEVLL